MSDSLPVFIFLIATLVGTNDSGIQGFRESILCSGVIMHNQWQVSIGRLTDEVGVRHVRKLVPRFCHDKSINMRPHHDVFAGGTLEEAWTNSSAMYKRKASSPQPS